MDAQLFAATRDNLTVARKMVETPATEEKAGTTTPDADAVIVSAPYFCPNTGAQLGTNDTEFSLSGLRSDIARAETALQAMKDMLAELEAAK